MTYANSKDTSTVHLINDLRDIGKFRGATWGPPGSCGPHAGPMNLAIGISFSNMLFVKSYGITITYIPVRHEFGEFKLKKAHMELKALYRAHSNPAMTWNLEKNISYLCKPNKRKCK